ncbi:MAG: AlpA family phage regulatory protein [Solimonas sp.]
MSTTAQGGDDMAQAATSQQPAIPKLAAPQLPHEELGSLAARRFLPFTDTRDALGLRSRQAIYDLMRRDPSFPKPVKLGRRTYFVEGEIVRYLEALAAQRGARHGDQE